MIINKQDTNGTKPLLGSAELAYDNYTAGGDKGRIYVGTGTENIAIAKKSEVDLKVNKTDIDTLNAFRADKYLSVQNIAKMIYDGNGDLSKIRYISDTDSNYELFTYTNGDLTGIAHYVSSVLKGNSILSYTDGSLSSVIFVGV